MPLKSTAEHTGRGGWPLVEHPRRPHTRCRCHGNGGHLTVMVM